MFDHIHCVRWCGNKAGFVKPVWVFVVSSSVSPHFFPHSSQNSHFYIYHYNTWKFYKFHPLFYINSFIEVRLWFWHLCCRWASLKLSLVLIGINFITLTNLGSAIIHRLVDWNIVKKFTFSLVDLLISWRNPSLGNWWKRKEFRRSEFRNMQI